MAKISDLLTRIFIRLSICYFGAEKSLKRFCMAGAATHLPNSFVPRTARIPLDQHGLKVAAPQALEIHQGGQVFQLAARQAPGLVVQLPERGREMVTFEKRPPKTDEHAWMTPT